jgi:histidine triad (HIT) family protein
MEECLFCQIAKGNSPAAIVKQDEFAIAFRDTRPQAPTHILIIPRLHIASLQDAKTEHQAVLGHLLLMAQQLAREERIVPGYRIVVNNGPGAGQTVFHLHVHLIGGRALRWPPG